MVNSRIVRPGASIDDGDSPGAALTPEQAQVLLLVRDNRSSKEIARELGISKSAVDQRLDRARAILGASTRAEAARIFADLGSTYDRITRDPSELVGTDSIAATMASAEADVLLQPNRLRDVRQPWAEPATPVRRGLMQLIGSIEPRDLNANSRLLLSAVTAIAVLMAVGGIFLIGTLGLSMLGSLYTGQ
jgi:DNA-binding CsgD family transcriptional regulator